MWDETSVRRLLDDAVADVLYFAGCEENMVDFLSDFDSIVLLTAPAEVLIERVKTRANNPFGQKSEDLERITFDIQHIEPRLKSIADVEIRTDEDLELVVTQLLLLT